MAELLVRVVDNNHSLIDNYNTKRGHVIVVQEDGWRWGKAELSHPHWRIIRIPGVPANSFEHLLAPMPAVSERDAELVRPMRAFKLDLEHALVNAAGLRTFFDAHDVVPITVKRGSEAEAVVAEVVQSDITQTIDTPDGGKDLVLVGVLSRTVTSYKVELLDAVMAAKVANLAVDMVDSELREHVEAEVTIDLLLKIQVDEQYSATGDPVVVIGDGMRTVIG